MEPLTPRITKSTAVAAIKARFPTEEALLERFEIAKAQANLWDGERDGLREAVKSIEPGVYGKVILTSSTGAEVVYPNAAGKFQLEECLQCTIPAAEAGIVIAAYSIKPEEFLDAILKHKKADALAYLKSIYIGEGITVANSSLFEKKGSVKSCISILP